MIPNLFRRTLTHVKLDKCWVACPCHAELSTTLAANFDKLICTHTHTHAIKLDELSCQIKCFIDAHIMQNTKQQLDKQSKNINISWQLQLFRLNCDALFPFFLLYCRRRKPGNKTGQFSARKGAQTKEKEEENSMKGVGNALSFPFRQRRQFWPTLKANEMMTKSLTAGKGTKSH